MDINKHSKILFSLVQLFDYQEYVAKCLKEGITPNIQGIFYQKAGIVAGARFLNPNQPEEAYLTILTEMNDLINNTQIPKTISDISSITKEPCGGCGGGTIR